MEFFAATGKLKKVFFFFYNLRCSMCVSMLMHVWQELEYRIYVCRVTHGAHIEHL
jgi:hypothetical protein